MTEHQIGELLLEFALLLALTYLMAGLLERVHIPGILGALFAGMVIHYLPLGGRLLSPPLSVPISFLTEVGVLFLLFFFVLQIDLDEMRKISGDIVWITVLNTAFPFICGIIVMMMIGYGWILAIVIGLTRMPTAEAVIVPILDKFNLIRTRVGSFIIGAGVPDDVIEVIVISAVSIWIGKKTGEMTAGVTGVVAAIITFILISWISYRWLPTRPRNLVLLSMVVCNGMSRYHPAIEAPRRVGRIQMRSGDLINYFNQKLDEHRRYVSVQGEDMTEIRNWKWMDRSESIRN